MARKDLPAQAANIKRAVETSTACTSTTVESLKSYLKPIEASSPPEKKTSNRVGRSGQKRPQSRAQAIPTSKYEGKPGANSVEVPQEQPTFPQLRDRINLATEVVNVTLKSLTEAIRSPSPNETRLRKLSKSGASLANVLQPVCANFASKSPEEARRPRCSTSAASGSSSQGLRAQAECARVAFSALRLFQTRRAMGRDLPYLQLEKGMSALIGKLIALGFDDLAMKELRILKTRLDQPIGPSSVEQETDLTADPKLPEEKEVPAKGATLASLLQFQVPEGDSQLLELIVASQLQALKLIASKSNCSGVEAAVKHIRLAVSYSPVNLIERMTDATTESHTKAARQLELLAQSIVALSAGRSAPRDAADPGSSRNISPHTNFTIQTLALEVRRRLWQFSGHREDILKELAEPFSRTLGNYYRLSELPPNQKYESAITAFQSLFTPIETANYLPSPKSVSPDRSIDYPLLAVYQTLSDLAQECSNYEAAVQWIQRSSMLSASHAASSPRICASLCRIANLRLRAFTKVRSDEQLLDSLAEAINSLEGDIQGESRDLDDLIMALSSLRRQAFNVIQDHQKSPHKKSAGVSKVLDKCPELMFVGVKFLRRYLGRDSIHEEDDRAVSRYHQRRRLVWNNAGAFFESIAAMARLGLLNPADEWGRLDAALQECSKLATTLVDSGSHRPSEYIQHGLKELSLVPLSNAYWYRYQSLKQKRAADLDTQRALFFSIEILKSRSCHEKLAGLLPVKLERAGIVHEAARGFTEAARDYAEALRLQIEGGLLSLAADAAATRSLPEILGEKGDQSLLGRLLLAYPRVALQANSQSPVMEPVFDNTSLPPNHRGLLLEQQLAAVISIVRDQTMSNAIFEVLQAIARAILSVYTDSEFPIRRLRASTRLLQLYFTNSSALEPEIAEQILRSKIALSDPDHVGSDSGLHKFSAHLLNSRVLYMGLRGQVLDLKAMEGSLTSWSQMLRSCCDCAALQSRVDDVSEWKLQLDSFAEYLEMQGLGLLRVPVLHILIMIHEIMMCTEPSVVVAMYSALGSEYVRLGYASQAGHALHKASKYIVESEISGQATLKWKLAYAEYALGLGNVIKAEEHLVGAHEIFKQDAGFENENILTSRDRIHVAQMLADANYAYSLMATAKGSISEAFLYARQNVKLNYRSWAILEHRHGKLDTSSHAAKSQDKDAEAIVDQLSTLSIATSQNSLVVHKTFLPQHAAKFWNLVPRLFRGLVHLSQLYANEGLLQESRYYIEQAQKTAAAVDAFRLKVQSLAVHGNYLTRCGEVDKGLSLLKQAEEAALDFHKDQYMVSLYNYMADCYALQGELDSEVQATATAENVLEHLMKRSFIEGLNHQINSETSIELKMDQMTLCEAPPSRRQQSKPKASSKAPTSKPAGKAKVPQLYQDTNYIADALLLARMKAATLRQRAQAALRGNKLDMVASLLLDTAEFRGMPQDRLLLTILQAHLYIRQAQENMAADPVFCVLPESTVSYPSVANCRSRPETNLLECALVERQATSPSKKAPAKGSLRKPRLAAKPAPSDFLELLDQTQESLTSACSVAKTACSTASIHAMMDLLTKTLMMLSAVTLSRPIVTANSTFVVYSMELGRTVSSLRQNLPIRVERQLSSRREVHHWPNENITEVIETSTAMGQLDFSFFQTHYIDIIPPSWTVISMSLSESRNEIRAARMRPDRTPFILTLPLNRNNSRDADEESFSFQNAKEELQEIVGLANYSAYESQDMARKSAGSEWWEVRQALDTRMKELLVNVENIWLGGFRGVFSNCTPCPQLLSRFHQSLQNILDKHLPSRRRRERKKRQDRTLLESRVLELFIALGVPTEENDLDEALMDLLYFVIDILQFHGERNAYDEIDFDAIIVEVIDALSQYHVATKSEASGVQTKHTILVLDKALHAFPWESLPCMEGHAVSRLPSLGCLRDRIINQDSLQQQNSNPPPNKSRYVHRSNGASILNPSGDLIATQSKFEQPLRSLSGWKNIIQRSPTEDELKACLEKHEIFLYFGHGSGSQYIRARTVRNLEKCAVAVLMGCSSGALTEACEFEPYGTPINFMQAGCPALLANLWDVTDKDIDRFSHAVLEKWGLFTTPSEHSTNTTKQIPLLRSVNSSPTKRAGRARGETKVLSLDDVVDDEHGLSLDQAVAQSRDSCRLRYLNGAAPVVYGVPVFLRG